MNMPGFTAENSINKTRGRYCMSTAFDSQSASANVQPAFPRQYCRVFLNNAFAAAESGNDPWAEFWISAFEGCINA
jgi:hypothetical protein